MGERQAKVNEKRQYFKGWETLVILLTIYAFSGRTFFMKVIRYSTCIKNNTIV